MRLSLFLTLSAAASAFDVDVRRLKPEDVGRLHTDAFEQLAEVYKDKSPESTTDLMMDVSKILEGYCNEDDSACRNLAYEATLKQFQEPMSDFNDVEYPDYFHSGLKDSFNKIGESLQLINHDNLDEIVDTIEEITNEMREMEDADSLHQHVALASASVAVESLKFWHNVYSGNDKHQMRRKLQIEIFGVDLNDIINLSDAEILGPFEVLWRTVGADATAAIKNGINLLEAVGTSTSDAVFALGPVVFISIAYFAFPASTAAFVALSVAMVASAPPGVTEGEVLKEVLGEDP